MPLRVKKAYFDWEMANRAVRCYILASIASHLKTQISQLESGSEMLQTLERMFAKRQPEITDLINKCMIGGHELESAEQSLKEPCSINFTEGSIKPKGKPKGGNKNIKKKAVIPVIKSDAMKKPKGKCFKCGQKEHWEKNCPQATKKPGMGDLLIIVACLVENFDDKWIIDSGATNHVCYSL